MVLALLHPDRLRQLVVAGGDIVDDDFPLAVRVERPAALTGHHVTTFHSCRHFSSHHCEETVKGY